MARRDDSKVSRGLLRLVYSASRPAEQTAAETAPALANATPAAEPRDPGPRAEDNCWRIRLHRYPTSTNPRMVNFIAAISLDGHLCTGWMSDAAYRRLRPYRLKRDSSDGAVYGKATDTPAGRRGDLAELRRVWMALFDAHFGLS